MYLEANNTRSAHEPQMDLAEQLKIPVLVLLKSLYNIIELQVLENASLKRGPLIFCINSIKLLLVILNGLNLSCHPF